MEIGPAHAGRVMSSGVRAPGKVFLAEVVWQRREERPRRLEEAA